MDFSKTGIFKVVNAQMKYSSERHAMLAKNVAHANIPGYVAEDLAAPDFSKELSKTSQGLATTHHGHMQGGSVTSSGFKKIKDSKSSLTPVKNSVVLEEQVIKMAENSMKMQEAVGVYRKFSDMIKSAIGSR